MGRVHVEGPPDLHVTKIALAAVRGISEGQRRIREKNLEVRDADGSAQVVTVMVERRERA